MRSCAGFWVNMFLLPCGPQAGMKFLDRVSGNSVSIFLSSARRISKGLRCFAHPTAISEAPKFLPPPNTCYFLLLHCGHPRGCDVLFHCRFYLHFSVAKDAVHLFMCLLAFGASSLQKCLFEVFDLFFNIRLFVDV